MASVLISVIKTSILFPSATTGPVRCLFSLEKANLKLKDHVWLEGEAHWIECGNMRQWLATVLFFLLFTKVTCEVPGN